MARHRTLVQRVVPLLVVLLVALGGAADIYLEHVLPASVPSDVRASQAASEPYLVTMLTFPAVGFLIVWRQAGNAIGWILMGVGVCLALGGANIYILDASYSPAGTYPGAWVVGQFGNAAWSIAMCLIFALLPLLFPNGRPLTRRWAWVVRLVVGAEVIALAAQALDPNAIINGRVSVHNPIGLSSLPMSTIFGLATGIVLLGVVAGIVSLVLRYRRGTVETRLQLRWFIAACLVIPVVTIMSTAQVLHLSDVVAGIIQAVGVSLAPVAIGLAVVRYRLYDIDLVISRALVYGALAAFITSVYVAIVVGLGTLAGSGGRPNLLLSIAATAVVAVAFQPLRERLQKVANRLVYGRRATPYEVLSAFSSRVAESFSGDDVLSRMAQVLAEGTGADQADVWLRSGATLRQAASWPVGGNSHAGLVRLSGQLLPAIPAADRVVPVRHRGELLGALAVTKRPGESLTPIEAKLLEDLAHQAGLVLKNVGLTADLRARLEDLRASRQRIVAAQDAERRRLERNLHDGAQQHLVALKVKLGLVEILLDRDPAQGWATLVQLKSDADDALSTLRDLARGIYPPLLAEKGLVAALEAQAAKATLPVLVENTGIHRYSQDVEAAVYFCCLEALQNIQKYAAASRATISATEEAGVLAVAIEDDGGGFDPAAAERGAGLQNMQDRLDALGGNLSLESAPGAGTRVTVSIPVMPAPTEGARRHDDLTRLPDAQVVPGSL